MSSLDGLGCKQPRSRPTAVTHRIHTVWFEHRVETEHLTGRQCEVSEREGRGGGQTHRQTYMASCMSHQSSSCSSSSTWTEPPSRSAVRCDPRVSLLVTGVGWDSLPLGSGDLTQRAKRVEAGGCEVVRRERGVKKFVGVMGQGVREWRVRERQCGWRGWGQKCGRTMRGVGEGGWIKKKKRKTKIIEDISQAEAGLLRRTMLIEE